MDPVNLAHMEVSYVPPDERTFYADCVRVEDTDTGRAYTMTFPEFEQGVADLMSLAVTLARTDRKDRK